MNERIKELKNEAFRLTEWEELDYDKILEKFAQLIVRDNIRTLRSNGYDDAAKCLQDIHFGVDYPV